MISVIEIQRTVTASVEVEHPDDWTEEQVLAAAQFRSADASERASYWDSQTRTTVAAVKLDEQLDSADDMAPKRDPLQLTAEDLA